MELVGKVIQVLPIQEGTSKTSGNHWSLLTFIVEQQDQYHRKAAIELFGDDRIKNNPVAIDQVVTVSFDLESREFNGRWYTSARAWHVQQGVVEANNPAPVQTTPQVAPMSDPNANTATFDSSADETTDLPF